MPFVLKDNCRFVFIFCLGRSRNSVNYNSSLEMSKVVEQNKTTYTYCTSSFAPVFRFHFASFNWPFASFDWPFPSLINARKNSDVDYWEDNFRRSVGLVS